MHKPENALKRNYDPEASKIGMWLFIFTELLLFGGLFIIYSIYRFLNPDAFHLAAEELNTSIGALNTIILLVSSMAIAMSTSSIQFRKYKLTQILLGVTLFLGVVFLVNKYFEWGAKFEHGIFPGDEYLMGNFSRGEIMFYGLYFIITGLHALHTIIGMIFIGWVLVYVRNGRINNNQYSMLENSGLYWHLVVIIWIFLFPLFYLIT